MIRKQAKSAFLVFFFGTVAVAEPGFIYRQDPATKPPPSTPVLEGIAYTGTARPDVSAEFALRTYLVAEDERQIEASRTPASETVSPAVVDSPPVVDTEPAPVVVTPAPVAKVESAQIVGLSVESGPVVEILPLDVSHRTVSPNPNVDSIPFKFDKGDRGLWLWLGAGTNYQFYQQTVPELGKAKFQNIVGPTWFLRSGFRAERFGLDLSYKDTPGKMNSSETVVISGGEYSWKTISAEALYRPSGQANGRSSENSQWGARFGFQHHVMPFMDRNPFDAVITIRSNVLTMLTLGFDREIPVTDQFHVEWQMRFQHPILSGSTDGASFDVTPKIAIDGSIGGVVSRSKGSSLGVFWYGQWHQYQFDYSGRTSFSGDQSLFYSNIELRLGREF